MAGSASNAGSGFSLSYKKGRYELQEFEKLIKIMRQLRDPQNGCPWDRQQSFQSIAPYTLEEAYEVVDAIDRGNMVDLCDELGDLLLQVVYHSQMASEQGIFDIEDVIEAIVQKLIRRHPHIFKTNGFEDQQMDSVKAVKSAWEVQKSTERKSKIEQSDKPHSVLDGIALALPALRRGLKIQQRAAHQGFDWQEIKPIFDKVLEELDEVRYEVESEAAHEKIENEIGDLYFTVTNLARHLLVDPEVAARKANTKFENRFRRIEAMLDEKGLEMNHLTGAELEQLWQQAKKEIE